MFRQIINKIFKRNNNRYIESRNNRINAEIDNVVQDINHINIIQNLNDTTFDKEEFYKKLIVSYPQSFAYIKHDNQTLQLCELAVSIMPSLIKFCKYQTIKMCEYVVNKHPPLIQYTLYETNTMATKTIDYDCKLIKYIRNQTLDLCMKVVYKEPRYFKYNKIQTLNMCKLACELYPENIEFCKFIDEDLCLTVLEREPLLIRFIKKNIQTKQIIDLVFNSNYDIYDLVKFIRVDLLTAVGINTLYTFYYDTNDFKIDDICPFCLEEFIDKSLVTNSLCNHFYHNSCIEQWIKIKKTCPLCNQYII